MNTDTLPGEAYLFHLVDKGDDGYFGLCGEGLDVRYRPFARVSDDRLKAGLAWSSFRRDLSIAAACVVIYRILTPGETIRLSETMRPIFLQKFMSLEEEVRLLKTPALSGAS